MTHATDIVGVDPGLVHTGVVLMSFDPGNRAIHVDHTAIAGPNTKDAVDWLAGRKVDSIFIEGYRPRSHYNTDTQMLRAVDDFRRTLGGTVLNNTGVKKVVKRPLMELLGVWSFPTVTHHQDLRSAARIGLFGMLKNEQLNQVLTDVVRSHLAGRTWRVHS